MGAVVRRFAETLTKKKSMLAILTLLFIFPIASPSRYYLILAAEMLIWALLAMSYDVALGYTGLVSFGQAAPFGVGAYAAALLLRMGFSFSLAILAAVLFGAFIGLILGVFTFRVSGIYYALVTLAFAEVIFAVFNKWVELSGGETGISVPRPDFLKSDLLLYSALAISICIVVILVLVIIRDLIKKSDPIKTKILYSAFIVAIIALLLYNFPSKLDQISGGDRIMITVMDVYYVLALIPVILCYLVANRIVNSPMGRVFVAIRENEERVKMLGFNVVNYKLISSTISGILAGLAGALFVPFKLSISPSSVLSSAVMINVLLYSILGGLGTLIGPMLGAGIITLLVDELTGIPVIGEYWMLILGIFYILVILFLPYGIVITWKIKGDSAKKTFKKLIESIKKPVSKEHGQ